MSGIIQFPADTPFLDLKKNILAFHVFWGQLRLLGSLCLELPIVSSNCWNHIRLVYYAGTCVVLLFILFRNIPVIITLEYHYYVWFCLREIILCTASSFCTACEHNDKFWKCPCYTFQSASRNHQQQRNLQRDSLNVHHQCWLHIFMYS